MTIEEKLEGKKTSDLIKIARKLSEIRHQVCIRDNKGTISRNDSDRKFVHTIDIRSKVYAEFKLDYEVDLSGLEVRDLISL